MFEQHRELLDDGLREGVIEGEKPRSHPLPYAASARFFVS
jgi:hypothetical protein